MDLISALESLEPELEKGLDRASSLDELEQLRIEFLGRKGRLAQIMSQLPELAAEERPAFGQKANVIKERANACFEKRRDELLAAREAAALARFDASMPILQDFHLVICNLVRFDFLRKKISICRKTPILVE